MELQDMAVGKLSTREALIREIQERVKAELYAEFLSVAGEDLGLNGPLGEQIAIAAGSLLLADATPENVAEGIVAWLDRYFLQSPQNFGPQADGRPTPSSAAAPNCGSGKGLRIAGSCTDQGVKHCPCVYQGNSCCYCSFSEELAA